MKRECVLLKKSGLKYLPAGVWIVNFCWYLFSVDKESSPKFPVGQKRNSKLAMQKNVACEVTIEKMKKDII